MVDRKDKARVLLAQFPLETHSRGIITVAAMLRDAGMEVVLVGNASPAQIVQAAVQEDADVIGISTYCGGELALSRHLITEAERQGIKDQTVFLLGGIFPPQNAVRLRELGFDGVFPPSSTAEEIISCIEEALTSRKTKGIH